MLVVRLLQDRYVRVTGDLVHDLATGEETKISSPDAAAAAEDAAYLQPIVEALDHGRDGFPRWLVVEARSRRHVASRLHRCEQRPRSLSFEDVQILTTATNRDLRRT